MNLCLNLRLFGFLAEGLAEDVAEGLLEENPEGLQSTPRDRLNSAPPEQLLEVSFDLEGPH